MNLFGKIIVIKRDGTDGAHFPLTVNCCLFGRSLDCDIRIHLPSVDLSQCQIEIDDKGHVFIKELSSSTPTLVNDRTLSTLTALSHGDVITIVDRQFRFEYPSRSPNKKSPKAATPGKNLTKMSPRPTPLSPRTDNVPSSSQTGKGMKSPKTPPSAKKEINVNNNRMSLPSPSAAIFRLSPAASKKSPKAPSPKMLQVTSSPVTAVVKQNVKVTGSPYSKKGSNLRKSISDLRRRSMPVFETDEANTPSITLYQKSATPAAQIKRKSPGFTMPSAKRKRVSFGPDLSPEHFDKNLPPKTPVKRGATPNLIASLRRSLAKGKSRSPSPAKKATPAKARSPSPAKKATPAKARSPSPAKKATPAKARSPSPAKSATPAKAKTPSSSKKATPAKARSPSPTKKATPAKARTPSPAKQATPAKARTPSPVKKATPAKARTPSPAKEATPAKGRKSSIKGVQSPHSLLMSPDGGDLFSQLTPVVRTSFSSASIIEDTPKSSKKGNRRSSVKLTMPGPDISSPAPKTSNSSPVSHAGLKRLLKTPKANSPASLSGVKRLMKTPKVNSPASPGGLERLMKTPKNVSPAVLHSVLKTPGGVGTEERSPKIVKSVHIDAPSPLGVKRLAKTPVVKRVGRSTGSPVTLALTPKGKQSLADIMSNDDLVASTSKSPKISGPRANTSVVKTPVNKSPLASRPQSLKTGRTPKAKTIFDSSPKATTPKSSRKSIGKTPASTSKQDLKEKIAKFASPGEKIVAPPRDMNKVVALRAIHGITPKLSTLQNASKTPKSIGKRMTPKSGRKSLIDTPVSQRKLTTVKTWADVAKTAPARRPLLSNVAKKKTPKKVVKNVKPAPKVKPVPSPSLMDSPATVYIGKKAFGGQKAKTPKPLPRKGRKKSMGRARKSLGNVNYAGVEDLFNSPEQSSSSSPNLSESALYADVPITPTGPNEMMVSPLSGRQSKSAGGRKSVKLTGLKELFTMNKRQSVPSMVGVRELYQEPESPANVSLKGVRELLKTPKPVQGAVSPHGLQELFVTPKNMTATSSKTPKSSGKKAQQSLGTPKSTKIAVSSRKRKIEETADAPSPKKKNVQMPISPSPVKARGRRGAVAKKSPIKKASPVKTVNEEVPQSPSPVKARATRRGVAAKKTPVKVSPVKKVKKTKVTVEVVNVPEVNSPSPVKPRATRRGGPVKKVTPAKKVVKSKAKTAALKVAQSPEKVVVKSPSPIKSRNTRRAPAKSATPVKAAVKSKATKRGAVAKTVTPVKQVEEVQVTPVVAPEPSPAKRRGRAKALPTKKETTPKVAPKGRKRKADTELEAPVSAKKATPSPVKPRATKRGAAAKKSPVKKVSPASPKKVAVPSPAKPRATRRGAAAKKSPVKKATPVKASRTKSAAKETVSKVAKSPSPVKARGGRRGTAAAQKSPVKKVAKTDIAVEETVLEVSKSPSPVKARGGRRGAAAAKKSPVKKATAAKKSPVKKAAAAKKSPVKKAAAAKKAAPVVSEPSTKVATGSRKRKADDQAVKSPVKSTNVRGRKMVASPKPKASPKVTRGKISKKVAFKSPAEVPKRARRTRL